MERQHHPKQTRFARHLEEKESLDFFRNVRLRKETFYFLLNRFKIKYDPQHLRGREPVPPKTCLFLTLWYLGNKATYREIAELLGFSEAAVHRCVNIGVNVICELGSDYIKWPSSEEALEVGKNFKEMVGFPGV